MDRREFLVAAGALPFTWRSIAGGSPVALVTADTQARVAVVELSSGRILRSVATLPGPRSIESVSQRMGVVCHTQHGAVTLIDGHTLRIRRVVRGFGEPRYAAVAPNRRHVFISDSAR